MQNALFTHRSSLTRAPLRLPEGKRIAVWIGVSIEYFELGKPALSLVPHTVQTVPDPLNYGWRDYGPRAGFERVLRRLDDHGVRATGILNSDAAVAYPEIVAAANERGWAWVAHGRNNSTWHAAGMTADEEDHEIADIAATIAAATGTRPRGWLGPALTSTMHTNDALAGQGFDYTLDWPNDDLPYDLTVQSGRLLSVPHSAEVNDIGVYVVHHQTGPEFVRVVTDQFDALYAEGARAPRILSITLHPFLSGQPFRARYLDEALSHVAGREDVWLCTTDQLADWYTEQVPPADPEPRCTGTAGRSSTTAHLPR